MIITFSSFNFFYQNDDTLIGAFEQHSITWFEQQESLLKSKLLDDSTTYLFRSFPAGARKYHRMQGTFKPLPTIEYVYNQKNNQVQELHFEWDADNEYKTSKPGEIAVDSSVTLAGFNHQYKFLSRIITNQLQSGKEAGSAFPNDNGYVEMSKEWVTDKLTCTLYLIYSDIHQTQSKVSITPTHRIRVDILWKN